LKDHPEIRGSDLLFLTETDYGMARSGNRFVAKEIADALGFHFAFVPSYLNLDKGSGLEAEVGDANTVAIHGSALLCRYPLRDLMSVPMPNGSDKMKGREKRIGCPRAIVATAELPDGPVRAVSLHLDVHSSPRHRRRQMRRVLDALAGSDAALPTVIGGDFNTSTHNASSAVTSILGYYWQLVQGPGRVLRKHLPYPDRRFDRFLFRELEAHGYRYRDLNEPGGCTLHYDVEDLMANSGLAERIPNWCFWWVRFALSPFGGRCSLKLDWFAGRGLRPAPGYPPRVHRDLREQG
jgi:hypothetical protein